MYAQYPSCLFSQCCWTLVEGTCPSLSKLDGVAQLVTDPIALTTPIFKIHNFANLQLYLVVTVEPTI